jgi:hypothetical protein
MNSYYKIVTAKCRNCGKEFTAKSRRKKYCSSSCTTRAYQKRFPYRVQETADARVYKLPKGMYMVMLGRQGCRCAICGDLPGKKRLAIDHNHITDKVRGLLCTRCNTAIAMFKDRIDLLKNAINYLETHGHIEYHSDVSSRFNPLEEEMARLRQGDERMNT